MRRGSGDSGVCAGIFSETILQRLVSVYHHLLKSALYEQAGSKLIEYWQKAVGCSGVMAIWRLMPFH